MHSIDAPAYSITSASNAHTDDVPPYSAEPALDERIIDLRTPSLYRPVPTGTYSRAGDNITLTLGEQIDGTKVPSYGRQALVKGGLVLNQPEDIVAVDVKVRFALRVFSDDR